MTKFKKNFQLLSNDKEHSKWICRYFTPSDVSYTWETYVKKWKSLNKWSADVLTCPWFLRIALEEFGPGLSARGKSNFCIVWNWQINENDINWERERASTKIHQKTVKVGMDKEVMAPELTLKKKEAEIQVLSGE